MRLADYVIDIAGQNDGDAKPIVESHRGACNHGARFAALDATVDEAGDWGVGMRRASSVPLRRLPNAPKIAATMSVAFLFVSARSVPLSASKVSVNLGAVRDHWGVN